MCPVPALTAGAIADLVGGELLGSGETVIEGIASLERAGPGDLSFLASARYLPYLERTHAGAVLLGSRFRDVAAGPACRIVVDNPSRALIEAARLLSPAPEPCWGLHPTATVGRGTRWRGRIAVGTCARIGAGVRIGTDCVIGPFAVVEDDALMGDHCAVGPHAVVHAGTILGDRVTLHAGAKAGSPGFSFTAADAGHVRMPHLGGCRLENDVEIGSNTTVDRGSLGDTVLGEGTKIDNLVQIAHNVRIGSRCIIMAQVGIAGSTVVEDDVMLAGQAGLADHLTVGRGARVAAQAGVIGDIPSGSTVSGYPARRHRDVLRQAASLGRLAPLTTSLERLAGADDHD